MKTTDYIKNFTKEINSIVEEYPLIVSVPNECFLTFKDRLEDDKLIQFLAEHSITNLESTFSKEQNKYPTANIGFSEPEQKWYGWSHRAIFEFGIGSKVKKGEIAYVPTNKEDFIEDMINFWKDEDRLEIHAENITEDGFEVVWTWSNMTPNIDIRGQKTKIPFSFPKEYGKGEWMAETLEDAKQMAIDFANNIA